MRAHLIYSPKLGLPLSSRYDYKSKTRETHLRTEARWIGRSGKTTVQAAQLEKKKGE